MTNRSRLPPTDRKRAILDAALRAAGKFNYNRMTRQDIANEADCSPALVSRYFGTMAQMQRTVMREAVRQQVVAIVAQGLANDDANARKADPATLGAARSLNGAA